MFYIFDWDGTISDSAGRIVQCMQEAADDIGLKPRSADEIKNIIGLAMKEAILTLYPELDESQLQAYREAYARLYRHYDEIPSEFFPQAMETLEKLRDNKVKLAVATGKSRAGLDRILSALNLNDFFHHSRCADETASKPHPLMLEELLKEARLSSEQAVMIGDTEWDMRMADGAGMRKIAVDYGAHTPDRLKECRPDLMISRFEEILSWQF